MNIIDVNNRLMQFLKESPYEGFHLKTLSSCWDYDLKNISKFANAYDDTGELTLLYLASVCQEHIDDTVVSVKSVLTSPGIMKPYSDCKALIESPLVRVSKQNMTNRISAIIAAISGKKLLGDGHSIDDELEKAIYAMFECFRKLRFEVYVKSGRAIEGFNKFSSSVQVSNSLAEMLLRLEGSPDGIYVGYVANPGTLDGWFGFFCKSNGNMFSYNERIDEAYVGQHRRLRNGRYAENKAYDLFPYELCEFSDERDYKGYAKEVSMGSNRKLFDVGDFSIFVRTVLSMAVISRKHSGHVLKGKAVVIDSLLPANLARLGNSGEDTKALVKWEGSQLVKAATSFKPPQFEEEKVLSGFYNKEFCYNEERPRVDTGWFYGLNQDIVDAYGDGFKINQEQVLGSNSSRRLIGDGDTEQEFIGAPSRLRLRAYMEVRRQLANHIGKKLYDDFHKFGGVDKLKEWYAERLMERLDKVLSYCADTYTQCMANKDEEKTRVEFGEAEAQDGKNSSSFCRNYSPLVVRMSPKTMYGYVNLSEYVDRTFICPVTQCKATTFFLFDFSTYKNVQKFLGCALPKFCVGWHDNPPYNGNCLLDVTDPVGDLTHPLYSHFDFSFSIGLSKRALKQITSKQALKQTKQEEN